MREVAIRDTVGGPYLDVLNGRWANVKETTKERISCILALIKE
jgi:hypothetical protein